MKPKLVIFRSNKYLYAQLVKEGKTVAEVHKATDPVVAGKDLAQKILKLKIKEIVFDRNGRRYHGNIKKFADSARQSGLVF